MEGEIHWDPRYDCWVSGPAPRPARFARGPGAGPKTPITIVARIPPESMSGPVAVMLQALKRATCGNNRRCSYGAIRFAEPRLASGSLAAAYRPRGLRPRLRRSNGTRPYCSRIRRQHRGNGVRPSERIHARKRAHENAHAKYARTCAKGLHTAGPPVFPGGLSEIYCKFPNGERGHPFPSTLSPRFLLMSPWICWHISKMFSKIPTPSFTGERSRNHGKH